MKKYLLCFSALLCAGAMTLTGCSNNDDPKPSDDNDNAATLDYNEKNAASWGNYMQQVAILLQMDSNTLYEAWTVSYDGGAPFATSFKQHNGGDYSSALSCVEQIIEGCAHLVGDVGAAFDDLLHAAERA